MEKPQAKLSFRGMALAFKIRDLIRPRGKILQEIGLKPGFRILDFGCGPGSYIGSAARLVGPSGKIYALDVNPLALEMVRKIAKKKGLTNVETIRSAGPIDLPDGLLDVVLLYDTFHHLGDSKGVLKEIYRVLKPEGYLSFSDHHLREKEISEGVAGGGQFVLSHQGRFTYTFTKN